MSGGSSSSTSQSDTRPSSDCPLTFHVPVKSLRSVNCSSLVATMSVAMLDATSPLGTPSVLSGPTSPLGMPSMLSGPTSPPVSDDGYLANQENSESCWSEFSVSRYISLTKFCVW